MIRESADEEFSTQDGQWMQLALDMARQGRGFVEPNPMVGCVLVANSQVIGCGAHMRFGGPHAERVAIADAVDKGNGDKLAGSTAYVSLEPCCHHGKTPPCTDALLECRVARVVMAMLDPFVDVRGRGAQCLADAGLQVQIGLKAPAALALNAPYLKCIHARRPWVIGKWAMSLDGKLATRTGHSQWISSATSRETVHHLRSRVDAILVGRATALSDDPLLTARIDGPLPRQALRVVVDSQLSLPTHSRLAQSARQHPTLLWAGPKVEPKRVESLRELGCQVEVSTSQDPNARLDELLVYLVDQQRVTNLLVEGGGQLLGSLLQMGQIDECEVFVAPKLIGGSGAPSPIAGLGFAKLGDGPSCQSLEFFPSGADLHLRCRLNWETHQPRS